MTSDPEVSSQPDAAISLSLLRSAGSLRDVSMLDSGAGATLEKGVSLLSEMDDVARDGL